MEFGETIPLFFITMCCIGVTPPLGFALLALIRFALKDPRLARNILITVSAVAVIAWSFPTWQVTWALPLLLRDCGCDSPLVITPGVVGAMFLSSITYGAKLIYPGLAAGFVIAFLLVLPITLVVRSLKKRKAGGKNEDCAKSSSPAQEEESR